MKETIEAAVIEAVQESVGVSVERQEVMNTRYETQYDEFDGDEYEYEVREGTGEFYDAEVSRDGYEFEGSNDEFAKLITENLLQEGDIRGRDARKVLKIVVGALNDYPTKEINGRVEHYYEGPSAEAFAEELAEKIEPALENTGLFGKIAGMFRR